MAVNTLTNANREEYNAAKGFVAKQEETPPAADPEAKVEAVEPAEDDAAKSKKKHSIDERLAKLAEQKREAIATAEEAKKERDALKARLDAIEGKAADDEPKAEKFTDAVEFGKAYGKWLAAKERKEDAARQQAERESSERKKIVDAWNKEYSKVSKQYEDFDEVMADPLNLAHGTVIDAIYESDIGPHINYYLSKNRDEAEKINEMGVKAALKYLGRIEAKIETQLEAAKEAKKAPAEEMPGNMARRKIAPAPAPITPVRGIGSTTSGSVDSNGEVINDRQFRAEMKKKMYS